MMKTTKVIIGIFLTMVDLNKMENINIHDLHQLFSLVYESQKNNSKTCNTMIHCISALQGNG